MLEATIIGVDLAKRVFQLHEARNDALATSFVRSVRASSVPVVGRTKVPSVGSLPCGGVCALGPPEDTFAEALDRHHPDASGQHGTPAHFANAGVIAVGRGEFHLSCSRLSSVALGRGWDAPSVARRIPFF